MTDFDSGARPSSDAEGAFDEDADAAFALYELVAPDLPTPSSIRREMAPDPEIAVWAVHAKGGVVRMKVATTKEAAVRVRRGAALLPLLSAQGLRVPEALRLREQPGRQPVCRVEPEPDC